jgi:metal transporter CNNM
MKKEAPLIRQSDDGIDRGPRKSPLPLGISRPTDQNCCGASCHSMTHDGGYTYGIDDPHHASNFPPPGGRRPFRHVLVASLLLGVLVLAALFGGAVGGASASSYGGGPAGLLRRRGLIRSDGYEYSGARNGADAVSLATCDADCCSALIVSDERDGRHLQSTDGNSTDCPGDENNSVTSSLPTWVTWILVVFLVCMSALFSGLTLGLMGLDPTGLEIVMNGDNPDLAKAAEHIYPVRKNGNRLLCTLLLGNVAVNALLSILMADVAGGLAGFLVSTAVIVIFGEILPQAACSRYALQIGSRAIPIIKVIICLMLPLAAPLGWALDKLLGHELGTTYSKAEMTKLLEIHVKEGRFNQETGTAMAGALMYQDMAVKEVMTPIENAYMLAADARLGYDLIAAIFKTGFSRIPVYEVSRNNVIGLLFTKDLIFIDPEDETPVRTFAEIFCRGLHVVWPDDRLGDVLRDLKKGHSHMALVRDVNNDDPTQDPYYEIKGIITLEDIIEVILGDDIVDETDAFVDATHSIKVDRSDVDFDWARLRLLDAKIVDEMLAAEEVKAVTAHLRTNYSESVSILSETQLRRLVSKTPVTELKAAEQEVGADLPKDLLYEKGKSADFCTLILSGKVTVLAGAESFRADVSSWSVLAPNALTDPTFTPDFTAFVSSDPCRVLRLSRHDFIAAADASAAEKYARPGHSVTVDMDNKDLRIGLGDKSQSDLVIDVDRFDKVKISSTPAAEGSDVKVTCTVEGESGPTGAAEVGAKEKAVVIVEPEKSKSAIAVVRPIVSGPETGESADDVLAKREQKRKQQHRHRSKLLAAFMKKKSDLGDDGTDGKIKADEKPSAKVEGQMSSTPNKRPLATATPPAAQAESSTSENSAGRSRSSSIGVLKELSVRQKEKE